MTLSFTDALQQDRSIVVAVDGPAGRIRLKNAGDVCTDLTCSERTVVLADDGSRADLAALNAGDIVKVEQVNGRPERIVVVRRVWEELTSPEW